MIGLLPKALKMSAYRLLFGYRIGTRVRIGFSIIDARHCEISDNVTIGHGNVVTSVDRLVIGEHCRIGHLNMIRGGHEVSLGPYVEILRLNEINSIIDPVADTPLDPRLTVGSGSVITTGHKIDFTDRVEIGRRVILGGRNSSIWTHNRQRTLPVRIGDLSYIGSESRLAPGARVPSRCIVGIGAVVVDSLECAPSLIGGVPARPIRALEESDLTMIERKTREDLPEDL